MRYILLISFALLTSTFSFSNLESPFKSTVPGLDTPNSHFMDGSNEKIIRGQAPRNDAEMKQLLKLDVTDFLVFKTDTPKIISVVDPKTKKEKKKVSMPVRERLQRLKERYRINGNFVHHIPFQWKNHDNFRQNCERIMQALRLMKDIERSQNRKLFFHCTVGEDRTGALAGIYHLIKDSKNVMSDPNKTIRDVFTNQMCENGFGAGNPQKPVVPVVKPIRKTLTPLFLKMAYKVASGRISIDKLSSRTCAYDPALDEDFDESKVYDSSTYVCSRSTKYVKGKTETRQKRRAMRSAKPADF